MENKKSALPTFRPKLEIKHCNIQAPIYNIYEIYVAMKEQ
jgi:hypothetical protein